MTGRQYNNHLLRIFIIAHQAAQKSAEKKEIIKETKENAQIVLVNIQILFFINNSFFYFCSFFLLITTSSSKISCKY